LLAQMGLATNYTKNTKDLLMKTVWPRMNTKEHERFAGANGVGHELYEKHERFADENGLATNEHERTRKICWRKWSWPQMNADEHRL
jgi:hypothetical protein